MNHSVSYKQYWVYCSWEKCKYRWSIATIWKLIKLWFRRHWILFKKIAGWLLSIFWKLNALYSILRRKYVNGLHSFFFISNSSISNRGWKGPKIKQLLSNQPRLNSENGWKTFATNLKSSCFWGSYPHWALEGSRLIALPTTMVLRTQRPWFYVIFG